MPCCSIQNAVTAALFASCLAFAPHRGRAADVVAPFSAEPPPAMMPLAADGIWLTPELAFPSEVRELPEFFPSLPLLSIPTAQPSGRLTASLIDDAGGARRDAIANRELQDERVDNERSVAAESDVAQPGSESTAPDGAGPLRSFTGLQRLGESPTNPLEHLPRLMLTTLFVVATCFGTLIFGRRWLMKSGLVAESHRNSRLKLVASLSVSPRTQLHVVRFDDREVLVGVDSRGLQQIQMIAPSFETVMRMSQEQEPRSAKAEESHDIRSGQPARRLFTAA
ncbi:MAG: flagellar biosynthetic protein FliO [Planctomycetaceae bacterium]